MHGVVPLSIPRVKASSDKRTVASTHSTCDGTAAGIRSHCDSTRVMGSDEEPRVTLLANLWRAKNKPAGVERTREEFVSSLYKNAMLKCFFSL